MNPKNSLDFDEVKNNKSLSHKINTKKNCEKLYAKTVYSPCTTFCRL